MRRRLLAADAVAERQAKRCGSAEDKAPAWEEVAKIANDLAGEVGIASACEALGVCRSTYYRRRARRSGSPRPRPAPPRALSAAVISRTASIAARLITVDDVRGTSTVPGTPTHLVCGKLTFKPAHLS